MEELFKKFGDRIDFIGVNLGTEKNIAAFIKKYGLTFLVAYDRGNAVASIFGAKIETNILIDRNGTVKFEERGFRDDMEQFLIKLLDN